MSIRVARPEGKFTELVELGLQDHMSGYFIYKLPVNILSISLSMYMVKLEVSFHLIHYCKGYFVE